jgi:hypothetical protein
MIKTVNFSDFCDSFSDSYKNNFSYEGKRALYDYLEDYEDSVDEKVELDPIALCCEYTEYKNIKELVIDYPDVETMEDVEYQTFVIPIYDNDGRKTERFIIQSY